MIDLTTTLIGLGLVALCILPIVYFYYVQKKERKKFLESFLSLTGQQQVNTSQYDVWGHYCALAIDTSANKLFYFKKQGDKEEKALINLAEVERCSVINTKRALNEDQVIDRLELALTFISSRQSEKVLSFYSKDEGPSLNGELQLVEKWKMIISAHLEAKKKPVLLS